MLTAGTKKENPATIEERHAVMCSKGQGNTYKNRTKELHGPESFFNSCRLGSVVCLPLDPKFAGSNPDKTKDF
jgi:hypothetical protein